MSTEPLPPSQPDFVDQRAGLIVFGVLEIIIGCLCALMVPLMLFGMAVQGASGGVATDRGMMVFCAMYYGAIAAAFIWLGIGSILCRRWARALLLIISWSWLLVGVLVTGVFMVMFPQMMDQMPPGAGQAAFTVTMVMLTCMFLVVPGVMTFFYMRKNVKATCEARDPVRRWTDACPLPVLAMSVMMGCGAPMMLAMSFTRMNVMPFCGVLITGLPATLLFVVMAVLWGWLAWALYRLKPVGWWIAVIAFVLLGVSGTITFARVDMMDMYRQMGYPQQQIDQLQKFNFFQGKAMVVWMACCMVPWLGYLLWIKKFFRRSA